METWFSLFLDLYVWRNGFEWFENISDWRLWAEYDDLLRLTYDGQEHSVLKGGPLDEEHCEPENDDDDDHATMIMMVKMMMMKMKMKMMMMRMMMKMKMKIMIVITVILVIIIHHVWQWFWWWSIWWSWWRFTFAGSLCRWGWRDSRARPPAQPKIIFSSSSSASSSLLSFHRNHHTNKVHHRYNPQNYDQLSFSPTLCLSLWQKTCKT